MLVISVVVAFESFLMLRIHEKIYLSMKLCFELTYLTKSLSRLRMHGFGRLKSLVNGSNVAGRWAFGILDEYGRLLDDLGNMHSIKCPARRFGKNVFKPELASFIQGSKICDDNADDHNSCIRFAETAKSVIALSMFKIKHAEDSALAALKQVEDKDNLQRMLTFAGVKYKVEDPEIAKKFGMSGKMYNASKIETDQSKNDGSDDIIEEPVDAAAKEFACSSHFCIGDSINCLCVVKAMEVRRLIALFSSVSGDQVIAMIDDALSDAKPLLKFDCESLQFIICSDENRASMNATDIEDDESFQDSYFLCGPVFHKACHSLRTFYGLKMWKWYKSMRWIRVMKNAKSLKRSMRSIYGDGEFTERSESSFFSRWMIPDESRPQTARSLLDVSKNNVNISRIRHSLSVYIDPVYYENPPELDELRDLKIRATAEFEGYTVEIFEDEMQLICRVPAKRAILQNDIQSAGAVSSLKNTPKSALSTNSSAPSSNPSSRPSTKRIKKLARKSRPVEHFESLYPEIETSQDENADRPSDARVVHSRPGSAVRFFQAESVVASEGLLSSLVAGASIADPKSITNFASKKKPGKDNGQEEDDEEFGMIEDDDSENDDEDSGAIDDATVSDSSSDIIEQEFQRKKKADMEIQEYSDTSKAVKMSLRDGFTHYGLHLQWDLREIPSFETHRNGDIFEESENSSVAGSEYSNPSLPSSYARLLFA